MLIGINGFKETGKDTVGRYLVDVYGFERMAFADKMKDAYAALFNIPRDLIDKLKLDETAKVTMFKYPDDYHISDMTVRRSLQRFGTEMGRGVFGYDFWINQLLPTTREFYGADQSWHNGRKIVITDARFDNELHRIQALKGYTLRLERPGYEGEDHASEVAPPRGMIDRTIINDGTLDDLYQSVSMFMEYLHCYAITTQTPTS